MEDYEMEVLWKNCTCTLMPQWEKYYLSSYKMQTDSESLEHIYSECCSKVRFLSRMMPKIFRRPTLSTKLLPKSLDIRYEKKHIFRFSYVNSYYI